MSDIYNENCLKTMKDMDSDSISAIVTDPPYGLSFGGQKWDYDVPGVEIWEECLRVLKPGGYLLSFAGGRTYHRMVVGIEDAGFEIRDMIMWVYGSGMPKSFNLNRMDVCNCEEVIEIDGGRCGRCGDLRKEFIAFGSALKPAVEPIVCARKLLKGTIYNNVLNYGTGAINIDDCRVPVLEGERPTGSGNSGSSIFSQVSGSKGNGGNVTPDKGRWPSNLIHDGDDEVVSDFPVGKNGLSSSRFFYCAKPTKKEKGLKNKHPTVKPVALMEYLVKLVVPPGGLLYDPFMGSGTTILACEKLGISCIGSEFSREYFHIAEDRIGNIDGEVSDDDCE